MNISDLNTAAKQIAIKKALIELDPKLKGHEVTHYEKKRLFFQSPEGVNLITIPNHGVPLLGFVCYGKVYYQYLDDRHPEKLELLKALNSGK